MQYFRRFSYVSMYITLQQHFWVVARQLLYFCRSKSIQYPQIVTSQNYKFRQWLFSLPFEWKWCVGLFWLPKHNKAIDLCGCWYHWEGSEHFHVPRGVHYIFPISKLLIHRKRQISNIIPIIYIYLRAYVPVSIPRYGDWRQINFNNCK